MYMCVYTYTHVYTYIHIYMYIYIYCIYTHIYTTPGSFHIYFPASESFHIYTSYKLSITIQSKKLFSPVDRL